MNQLPWTDRTFPTDTPLSLFPGFLERLRGTPARLEDRIATLSADLITRRLDEKWSIQENAGHLVEVESLWLGRLDDFAAGLRTLRPAEMTNKRTSHAQYNSRPLPSILSEFRARRGLFVSRLESLDSPARERVAEHPRLKQPMRVVDMMLFASEHDDYHLARVTEMLRCLETGA
jgi:uncharacterized damage-inducible protein DinB